MADAEARQVPTIWEGAEDIPVVAVNQFHLQQNAEDGVLLMIGMLTMPLLSADVEERQAQIASVAYVPIRTEARFMLTEHRARELSELLVKLVKHMDERKAPR